MTFSSSRVTLHLKLTLAGHEIEAGVPVPAGPTPPRGLLPILQNLTDTVVSLGEAMAQAQGNRVSCQKGCGTCCRQMVPITQTEAFHLAAVVAELPAQLRNAIRKRFAASLKTLAQAGLLELMRKLASLSPEELATLDIAYFRLRIPCPFLQNESCGIHPLRPLACREFMVTSPAIHCKNPVAGKVTPLPLPTKVSHALAQATQTAWIPLILALEFASNHVEASGEITGPELLQKILAALREE